MGLHRRYTRAGHLGERVSEFRGRARRRGSDRELRQPFRTARRRIGMEAPVGEDSLHSVFMLTHIADRNTMITNRNIP